MQISVARDIIIHLVALVVSYISFTLVLFKVTEPFLKDGRNSPISADNTAVIAGTVGGVAALIAIVVMILFIIRIRRKR